MVGGHAACRRLAVPALAACLVLVASCSSGSPDGSGAVRRGSTAASAAGSPTAPPRRYVAIGDSIPFGGHFCGGCDSFVDIYGRFLAGRFGTAMSVQNRSQDDNLRSGRLVQELADDQDLRGALATADVVSVSLGHNDTPWNADDDPCDGAAVAPDAHWASYRGACLQEVVTSYAAHLSAVLATVDQLRAGRPTLVLVTDDYDDVAHDPTAGAAAYPAARAVVSAFAATACRVAAQHGAVCVDTYHAFDGPSGTGDPTPLLAEDHTHPNEAGHQLIARLLEKVSLAPVGG